MKKTQKIKIFVDILMTIALLCLMSYELIGQTTHEVIGVFMFLLFVVHHFLNRRWTARMMKGNYKAFRVVQTFLVVVIFIIMIAQAGSGIMLSRHLFQNLPFHSGYGMARTLHMLGDIGDLY
jgi:hypothetical protein